MNDESNKYRLSVYLFDDPAFHVWVDATADAAEAGTLSDLEVHARENYSSYSVAMLCDLTMIEGAYLRDADAPTLAASGCCFGEDETGAGVLCSLMSV